MRVALFNGIYFGRKHIRCEPFRPTPPVPQYYECQVFKQVAKDCRSQVKYMRCAKSHKSAECPEKERIPVALNALTAMGIMLQLLGNVPNLRNSLKNKQKS